VAMMNAFNLIDGMDGLASGLAAIAALGMCGALLLQRQPADVLVLLALLGSCLAFLRYNFHPASIFLGDAGSLFIGFALAAIALDTGSKGTAVAAIGMPLLAVGVPMFDTFLAVWRRAVRRLDGGHGAAGGVFEADADHLHHRLRRAGLSQPKAAAALYALAAALVVLGLASLMWNSHALGIYLIAFVLGVRFVVRHLAHVELWDTGATLVRGLSRPPRKTVAVLLYVPLDIAVLAASLWLALALLYGGEGAAAVRDRWAQEAAVWIGLPLVMLHAARTYRRVWSRARISEYALSAAALAGGALLAAGVAQLAGRFTARPLLACLLMYGGAALAGVLGVRILPRVAQDIMAWASQRRLAPEDERIRRVLLCGAGQRALLWIREAGLAPIGEQARSRLVGLLDDDANLHGRLVHGHPVLGAVQTVTPGFLKEQRIDRVVVTETIEPAALARLRAACEEAGAALLEWHTELRPVQSAPAA
jgi:UDP-GlcNAc:undecaprenyl-phosphate/decaprenyl-phosphate GlcNAc-1-phosphate transferase